MSLSARQTFDRDYCARCISEQRDALRAIVDGESGTFRKIYAAVFELVQSEPGFAAFAARAKALAALTKEQHPDFYQSATTFVAIYTHAVAVRMAFKSFFRSVAGRVPGGGCVFKLGPLKDMFRALEKTCMRTQNRWRADACFDIVRGQLARHDSWQRTFVD